MDLHIELELLKIDQSSTIGQINGLEAQIVTLKERALLLQKRTERLESINGVSKAESSSAAKDRGSLLSGNQSAVVEKESLSSERSLLPARSVRRRRRGRKNPSNVTHASNLPGNHLQHGRVNTPVTAPNGRIQGIPR